MKKQDIKSVFENRKAESIRKLKKSSVVIPLIEKTDGLHVLFEVRALTLNKQPGDVCLPGGKLEEGETYKEAAIREMTEELNIKEEDVTIIGEMDYFISPFGSIIYSFIGLLENNKAMPKADEVDHIFTVPLKFFLENEPLCHTMTIKSHADESFPYELIRGGKNYKFTTGEIHQYFYKYNEYIIWGITARIIKRFAEIIKENGLK